MPHAWSILSVLWRHAPAIAWNAMLAFAFYKVVFTCPYDFDPEDEFFKEPVEDYPHKTAP